MTRKSPWLLYGATGYTGRLILEAALRRGHRPRLAGRSRGKLEALARPHGLEFHVAPLDDPGALRAALEPVELVLHAAGPFVTTARPVREAALHRGAHYLDITGEIPVFEESFREDARAQARGVTVMSGVGFDVVPTDCLGRFVAEQVPGATRLELAIALVGAASAGTAKSALLQLPSGGLVRRAGRLEPLRLGSGARSIAFADRTRRALPIPWGDLSTAYRTTGIGDITTYMAVPAAAARLAPAVMPVLQALLRSKRGSAAMERWVERHYPGPDAELRSRSRALVWARAAREDGTHAQAWLETQDGYDFTALAALHAVERVLEHPRPGAQTPARAFGADFVLSIEGTKRSQPTSQA